MPSHAALHSVTGNAKYKKDKTIFILKWTVSRDGFGFWWHAWSVNDFITQRVDFSRLIRVCVGLLMLAASTEVQVSLLLIGCSRVWDISSCFDPCFPLAGFTLTPDETTNTNPSRETLSLKGRFLKIKLVGTHCSGWGYSAQTPSSWQKANLPSSQPFQGSTTHASKSIFFSEQNAYFIRLLLGNLKNFVNFDENSRNFSFAKSACL